MLRVAGLLLVEGLAYAIVGEITLIVGPMLLWAPLLLILQPTHVAPGFRYVGYVLGAVGLGFWGWLAGRRAHRATGWGTAAGVALWLLTPWFYMGVAILVPALLGRPLPTLSPLISYQDGRPGTVLQVSLDCLVGLAAPVLGAWFELRRERRRAAPAASSPA
jgi:hypothetical protein